jgi:hypothetical protein
MYRYLCPIALGALITAAPVLAQEGNRPFTPSGGVQVPSGAAIDRMLDCKTVPPPDKEFSANDAKAIQQMTNGPSGSIKKSRRASARGAEPPTHGP